MKNSSSSSLPLPESLSLRELGAKAISSCQPGPEQPVGTLQSLATLGQSLLACVWGMKVGGLLCASRVCIGGVLISGEEEALK